MSATDLQLALVIGQFLAAVALLLAAKFTYDSAKASEAGADATLATAEQSQEAIRGQLLARLLDEYGSTEYLEATNTLADWAGPEGGSGGPPGPSLDPARRLVKSYFRKVYHLHKRGYFTEHDLRDCLAEPYSVGLLLRKVEPAEKEKRADYYRRIFDFYDQFYDEELDRPLRDYTPPTGNDEAGAE